MSPNRHRSQGLTLIEVTVALGILVILAGGIFLVVQTSLRSVLLLDASASREDEISNIIDIFRQAFVNLPPTARLQVDRMPGEAEPEVVWIFRDAPNFLSWLPQDEPPGMIVVLSFRSDTMEPGFWEIAMKRMPAPADLPAGEFRFKPILQTMSQVSWLRLAGGFEKLDARFYDGRNGQWQENWKEPGTRPALIGLTLGEPRTEGLGNEKPEFWVPPVKVEEAFR